MRQSRNLERTSLHLDIRQLDELRSISDRTGIPVAHMVRSSVDRFLKQRAPDHESLEGTDSFVDRQW